MQCSEYWASGRLRLQPELIESLLGEVRDPLQRVRLLTFMLEIVAADGRVTNAEASLLSHAMRSWSEGSNTEWGLAAGRDARIAGGKVVAGRCRVVLPGRPACTRVCGERPQPCRPFGKKRR